MATPCRPASTMPSRSTAAPATRPPIAMAAVGRPWVVPDGRSWGLQVDGSCVGCGATPHRGHLRAPRRHLQPGWDLRRSGRRARPSGRPWRHARRADAGRGVPRRPRLGLRRRRPVRAAPRVTAARRISSGWSMLSRPRAWPSFSTWSTTTSDPRATTSRQVRPLLHRPLSHALGRRGQSRRRHSGEVRRFVCDNALAWVRDFHIDGLRMDAVHAISDRSAIHFLVIELRTIRLHSSGVS